MRGKAIDRRAKNKSVLLFSITAREKGCVGFERIGLHPGMALGEWLLSDGFTVSPTGMYKKLSNKPCAVAK